MGGGGVGVCGIWGEGASGGEWAMQDVVDVGGAKDNDGLSGGAPSWVLRFAVF